MNTLNLIFNYYDKLIVNLPSYWQTSISLVLLLVLLWQIFMVIKSGHWIFIAVLIIMLPSTWPATKHIALMILDVIKFLLLRTTII